MSIFKTLPVSDEPRVLLVGAPAWLIAQVSRLFADHEMRVVALSAEEFQTVDVASIEPASVYKILWWLEFADLEAQRIVQANFTKLKEVPLVILGRLPEQLLLEQEHLSQELKDQQKFFKSLLSAFPKAQFFFARDLLTSEQLEEPLRFSFRGLSQGRLLDPGVKWYISTTASFFEIVAPSLTRPHLAHRALVRGRGLMSGTLLRKCADALLSYYSDSYEVTPVLAERHSPALPGFVETALPVETGRLLDELMRKKAEWEPTLDQLSPPLLEDTQRADQLVATTQNKDAELAISEDLVAGRKRARLNEGKRLVDREKEASMVNLPRQEEHIEGELARIFQNKRNEQMEERLDDKVKIVKRIAKKSRKNKALFFGGMAALSLGGIVLALWGIFTVSTLFARRELLSFLADASPASITQYTPGVWANFLGLQANAYEKTLGKEWLGEGGDVADFETDLEHFQAEKQTLDTLAGQYFLGVLGRGETSSQFPQALSDAITSVGQAEGKLLQAAEQLLPASSASSESEQTWLEALKNGQQQLTLFSQFPEVFSSIFGQNSKQVYAVLLQNNLELRPTGGFIQAVGLLVFDKGLLVDSQVLNVYDLDNRLPGSVSAPAEIKKYLGEDTWYLRDANWNPDFPLTAQQVAWFVKQATGITVNGVWAFNYTALQPILEAIGPLELPAQNELLTKDNLLERVEFHSDDELAQSQTDKGYAFTIFSQLLRDLPDFPPEKAGQFLSALQADLQTKQILLSFTDRAQEEAMQKLGWSGEIINPACPQQFDQKNCLVDQIFEVESNIGLNRVNGYMKRTVTHEVDFSGEKVEHTRTLTLENTAHSDGWPLGTYKAYIRFILDGEAQPTGVTINGQKLAGDQVMIYGEGGRRVIGVPMEVPQQSKATLELTYTTETVPTGPYSFLLFDQKQSGIEGTPTTITFHNANKKAVLIAPTAKLFGDSVEFDLTQDDHHFVGASFQ